MERILSIENDDFVFSEANDLKKCFNDHDLQDEFSGNIIKSRAVIAKSSDDTKLLKLFRHIRNCLCHGKFVAVRTELNSVSLVMQDDNGHNVTARMVLDLAALIDWIYCISKRNVDNLGHKVIERFLQKVV